MAKSSTRKIVTSATKAVKPVTVTKPVAASPVAVVTAKQPTAAAIANATTIVANAAAKPSANVTRTVATIARAATNFGSLSDRDTAYLHFYATLAKRSVTGNVTVAGIVASGERPNYTGSNKPHDAGVIVRLTKAGHVASLDNGAGFTFTTSGKALAAYTTARA